MSVVGTFRSINETKHSTASFTARVSCDLRDNSVTLSLLVNIEFHSFVTSYLSTVRFCRLESQIRPSEAYENIKCLNDFYFSFSLSVSLLRLSLKQLQVSVRMNVSKTCYHW